MGNTKGWARRESLMLTYIVSFHYNMIITEIQIV